MFPPLILQRLTEWLLDPLPGKQRVSSSPAQRCFGIYWLLWSYSGSHSKRGGVGSLAPRGVKSAYLEGLVIERAVARRRSIHCI
jgi:hypothetical protein